MSMNVAAVAAAKGLTEMAACRRLRRMAAKVPADQAIVELGAYMGRTTAWLALGASEGNGAKVWSIDPWDLGADHDTSTIPVRFEGGYASGRYASDDTYRAFWEHMHATGAAGRVVAVKGHGATSGAHWIGPPVGLLWHDAIHTADAVEADLRAWLPHMADHAVIVCHDAGQPAFGVIEGAGRALADDPRWDWEGRVLHRWKKRPDRRGTLTIRSAP